MWHSYRQSLNRSVPLKQVVLSANNCAKSYVTHIALSFMLERSENRAQYNIPAPPFFCEGLHGKNSLGGENSW